MNYSRSVVWVLIPTVLLAFSVCGWTAAAATKLPEKMWVYVGTYTGAKSKGIYLFELNTSTGALTPSGVAAETPSPSFLALAPNKRFLYAANEVPNFAGKPSGAVSAFSIDAASGKLTALNQQGSGGPGPCHLVVDASGKNVLVANYSGGSVAVLPIESDGRLRPASSFIQHTGSSVNPDRQKEPHAHSINVDRDNRFAVAADLGLDKLLVYQFDYQAGTLKPNDPPFTAIAPGSGPRHFAFHPSAPAAYVINEMQMTVTALAYDAAKGTLKELQTISTWPADATRKGGSTAEVQVHPSGKFLYGSNRGNHSIAVFAIDPVKYTLTLVEHQSTKGRTPRNFGIDPTGQFLLAANQDTDNIAVFRIDQKTGKLSQA